MLKTWFFGLLFHREFWRWIRPIVYIPSIVQSSHRVLSDPLCLRALKSWLIFLFFPLKKLLQQFSPFFIKIFRVRRGSYSLLEIRMKRLDLALRKWTEIWPEPRFFNWLLLSTSLNQSKSYASQSCRYVFKSEGADYKPRLVYFLPHFQRPLFCF